MNMMKRLIAGVLVVISAPAAAVTVPTQWGVSASTHWADCSLLACDALSFALGINPIIQASQAGGLNQTTASQIDIAQVHDTFDAGTVNMGMASAKVELDNINAGVPVLRAAASSNSSNGWVAGLAFALAGYDYVGSAGTINLSATLTGTVTNPLSSDTTGLSAGIWIIRDDGSLTFPSPSPASLGELALFVSGLPVEDFWTGEDLGLGLSNHAVNLTTTGADIVSITFTEDDILNGNTLFYVMSGLSASSTNPGHSAISMSTLTMLFDDTSNLVAATAVPLPPALWFLGSALTAVATIVRRRKVA